MTKKEREQLRQVYCLLDHIVSWDNKNLKKNQYYDLDKSVGILKELLKGE